MGKRIFTPLFGPPQGILDGEEKKAGSNGIGVDGAVASARYPMWVSRQYYGSPQACLEYSIGAYEAPQFMDILPGAIRFQVYYLLGILEYGLQLRRSGPKRLRSRLSSWNINGS